MYDGVMEYLPHQYRAVVSLLGIRGNRGWERQESAFFTCPLGHIDKTPSLRINMISGIWYCHSCKQGGHLSQLCRRMRDESIDQVLGLKPDMIRLDAYANTPPPEPRGEMPEVDVRGALVPWSVSERAVDYLDFRGILPSTADNADMRFLAEGYANGTPLFNRLMIPVYDEKHRAINWEARDVTFKAGIKCLYPKRANKPIYEWWKLRKDIPLFLLEGLIKTMVARSDPYFANSTTPFGSGISEYQLEQLQDFPHIIVIPDKDEAGSTVVPFLTERWKGNRLEVLEINHPGIKDVDEIPTKLDMTVKDFRAQNGFVFRGTLENLTPPTNSP